MKDFLTTKVTKFLANFAILNHLSGKKCALSIILAMIRTRQVQFQELASELHDEVKKESNERKIQDFFKEADIDKDELAFFIITFFLNLWESRYMLE